MDRVEVMKGVGALLNGMAPNGSLGGTINFIPKRAGAEPKTSVTVSYGNKSQFGQNIDISRRSDDGKLGIRMNFYHNNGGASFRDERVKTHSGFISLDYAADRSRTTFDFGAISNRVENAQYRLQIAPGIINQLGGKAPHVDPNAKFGAPGTFRQIRERFGMLRTEYDIDKNLTGYAALGMRITNQDTLNNEFLMQQVDGRSRITHRYNNQINKSISGEVGLKAKVDTKGVDHELTIAASLMHYKRYMFQNQFGNGARYFTNMYAPRWRDLSAHLGSYTKRTPLNDSETLRSIALSDVMTTNDGRWTFVVGGRYQQITIKNYPNPRSGNGRQTTYSEYEEAKFSPAFALVHKLNKQVSLYANYIQGLKDGDEASTSAANAGEKMKPFVAKQYEVGAKFDFDKIATTLSFFSIKTPAMLLDPVTNLDEASGEVRNRGIEWMFFGEPKKGTRLTGGMTWLNATYQKTAGGAYDGNIQEGTPRYTAVLGVEQDIHGVPGLTFSTHMTYNSSTYADQANTLRVSPWMRWDLGARYRFNAGDTPVTVRADVYNIFNKNYWRALDRNAVFLGAGRTYMLSVTADF